MRPGVLTGIDRRPLLPHGDDRGTFTEILRDEWGLVEPPGCWELARIPAGTSRPFGEGLLVVLGGTARIAGEQPLVADEPAVAVLGAAVTVGAEGGEAMVAFAPREAAASQRPPAAATATDLPLGVQLIDLPVSAGDVRLYERGWGLGVEPVQWNAVRSIGGVLRGVHCHSRHADLLCVAEGHMRLALADLRGADRRTCCLDLVASRPQLVLIPPGVAHGFLFLEPSLHVYAVDRTWDLADELGCRWDDPQLAIPWGHVPERISPRDHALGSLEELLAALRG